MAGNGGEWRRRHGTRRKRKKKKKGSSNFAAKSRDVGAASLG